MKVVAFFEPSGELNKRGEASNPAFRRSVNGLILEMGSDHWVKRMAVTLGPNSTLRPLGRPKKD